MKLTLVVTEQHTEYKFGVAQKTAPVVTVDLPEIDVPNRLAAGILRAAADQIDPQQNGCDANPPWTVTR